MSASRTIACELLAGEFYTRTLTEVGTCIALPERHRLSTQVRVRLSDLKAEFFLAWDSQQVPGLNRQIEALLISCHPQTGCTQTPGGITTYALDINFNKASLRGFQISGDIVLGDAQAH